MVWQSFLPYLHVKGLLNYRYMKYVFFDKENLLGAYKCTENLLSWNSQFMTNPQCNKTLLSLSRCLQNLELQDTLVFAMKTVYLLSLALGGT